MKLSDFAGPSITAWIVALATVGALSFVPSRPASDEARVARPPIADVTVSAPAQRPDPSAGVDDMIFVGEGRAEEERYGYQARPYLDPES